MLSEMKHVDSQDTVLWSIYLLQRTVENGYINKNTICVYSVKHNNVFIALMATSFGSYDHHQANAIQNLKRLVTCSALNVQVYGISK
jgi:hypothetical protein